MRYGPRRMLGAKPPAGEGMLSAPSRLQKSLVAEGAFHRKSRDALRCKKYAIVPFQASNALDMSEFDQPVANYFRPHFHSVSIVAAPPGWRVLVTDALGAPFLALEQWVERIEDVFTVAEYLTGQ